jgi:hypothetical protein
MLAWFGPGKLTDHGRRQPAARGLAKPAGSFKPLDMRYRSRCEGSLPHNEIIAPLVVSYGNP